MEKIKAKGEDKTKAKDEYFQIGKRKSLIRDIKRKALIPGKRISKYGSIYYERRRNRSDVPGTKI